MTSGANQTRLTEKSGEKVFIMKRNLLVTKTRKDKTQTLQLDSLGIKNACVLPECFARPPRKINNNYCTLKNYWKNVHTNERCSHHMPPAWRTQPVWRSRACLLEAITDIPLNSWTSIWALCPWWVRGIDGRANGSLTFYIKNCQ